MFALFRKAYRDLTQRRVRSLLTIGAIAIGVAGIVAIVSTAQNLTRAQAAAYQNASQADITFFATGKSWTEVMNPTVSNIYGIWLFPILLLFPLAVIFDRALYKVTRNPYLGGIIFALIMATIACTNTLSQLP